MTFKKLSELSTITKNLDALEVPYVDNVWDRIVAFAMEYDSIYASKLTNLTVKDKQEEQVLSFKLSEDQEKAWDKLLLWLSNDQPYFLLAGVSGSGKSTLLKMLTSVNKDIYFTAPTNKATKVLSKLIDREAKTTYSQLGLRMSEDDDKLVMDYNNKPYMPDNAILVVDECSMISSQLYDFIEQFSKDNKVKVIYVGDPLQLPPVGEMRSKTWKCVDSNDNYSRMTKVMRHDNQILTLATRIRDNIVAKKYRYPIKDDHDEETGVFRLNSRADMIQSIKNFTSPSDFNEVKVIAWRNKTVQFYNDLIRENLGLTGEYAVGDIIMAAEPIELDGVPIAHIDDEFAITEVTQTTVKIWTETHPLNIPVYKLNVKNDDQSIVLNIPMEMDTLNSLLTELSTKAKTQAGQERKDTWKKFWTLKRAFHKVRFAYAFTAHRSQGSTLNTTFVDTLDILRNPNERESLKCLYVAVTRASHKVVTF